MLIHQELYTFVFHLPQPTVQDVFLHFEIRNTIAQQPPDTIVFFVDGHPVSGAAELLSGSQPSRPRPDDGHPLTRPVLWRFRHNPAFRPGMLNDRFLNLFYGDRGFVDAQHASRFAGRRADAAGELRKVIRRV